MNGTSVPESPDDAGGPLAGIRVVEAGRFAAGPSCATVLADWGAEVIKLEPPDGDPARGPGSVESGRTHLNPRFDVHNRSRRSVALDLKLLEGRHLADRLLGTADVFVTNMRPAALARLGLDPERQRSLHPRLIYAQITGYGATGSAADTASYDHGAFWSYSGLAAMFADDGGTPPQPTGGMGDRATGTALAGAVCAALLGRERTGRGEYVSSSLLQTAMWLMASDVADALRAPEQVRTRDRCQAPVPTVNCYRCADGRWLWLQCMEPDRDWAGLLEALDAHWLDDDPRFSGGSRQRLAASRVALVETLDEIFRQRVCDEWSARLSAVGIPFSIVQSLNEAVLDPVVNETGAFREVDNAGIPYRTVNSSCAFATGADATLVPAPSTGEHTEQVLLELGATADEIDRLREIGAAGCIPGRKPPVSRSSLG